MEIGQWINWGFWLLFNLVATWLLFRTAIKNEIVYKEHSAYYRRTPKVQEQSDMIKFMAWAFAIMSLGLTIVVAVLPLPFLEQDSISIFWLTILNWAVVILNAFEAHASSKERTY